MPDTRLDTLQNTQNTEIYKDREILNYEMQKYKMGEYEDIRSPDDARLDTLQNTQKYRNTEIYNKYRNTDL